MSAALPFTITGTTIPGKRLGSKLGFPTANLDYPLASVLPPNGVYIAQATVAGVRYHAILNQGHHPTTPEGRATIETHLLGYNGRDLYGQQLTLCYLHYLRPELKFDTLDALIAQMRQDETDAEVWFALHQPELLACDQTDVCGNPIKR